MGDEATAVKIDFLFEKEPASARRELQIDAVGLFSVTNSHDAECMADIMKQYASNQSSCIVDLTACVGGNTIGFSRAFSRVIAIELNYQRYTMLVNNLKTLQCYNVLCLHNDASEFLRDAHLIYSSFNVFFIDPPWGGPSAFKQRERRIYFDNTEIYKWCDEQFQHLKGRIVIGLKLPLHYFVPQNTRHKSVICYKVFQKLMLVVIIYNGGTPPTTPRCGHVTPPLPVRGTVR